MSALKRKRANMHRCHYRNIRLIGVMFWAFPYLLWQTFGHISGLFVGILLAVFLTMMLNNLFRQNNANIIQQPVRTAEPQQLYPQEYQWDAGPYQHGYQAEPYREIQQQPEEQQPPYDEIQVQYPEIPPIEQQ
jgi:hypothetical protein